jgi:hypothetical protein
MMRWEGVPEISLFLDNTAAFIHDLGPDALANAAGDNNYVSAAGDPGLVERTWVLITEAPDGGWGIDGHAHTGADIAEAARRELGRS